VFSQRVLVDLGVDEAEAGELVLDVRRRDEQRLEMQIAGGLGAGMTLMRGNIATTQPAPLVTPRKEAKALNEEAAEAIEGGD
jgi:glutathione-regulated potassium-efflux system protein KefB